MDSWLKIVSAVAIVSSFLGIYAAFLLLGRRESEGERERDAGYLIDDTARHWGLERRKGESNGALQERIRRKARTAREV